MYVSYIYSVSKTVINFNNNDLVFNNFIFLEVVQLLQTEKWLLTCETHKLNFWHDQTKYKTSVNRLVTKTKSEENKFWIWKFKLISKRERHTVQPTWLKPIYIILVVHFKSITKLRTMFRISIKIIAWTQNHEIATILKRFNWSISYTNSYKLDLNSICFNLRNNYYLNIAFHRNPL